MAPPSENVLKRDINSIWEHDLFEKNEQMIQAERQLRKRDSVPGQIIVSNLHQNVSEEDLIDLFSLVGNLNGVCIDCDKSGRPSGTARICFQRKVDATEAVYRYDGCRLDDKILKIEIETMPIHHKNNNSNDIQKKKTAAQSLDVAKVVDSFNCLKLQ